MAKKKVEKSVIDQIVEILDSHNANEVDPFVIQFKKGDDVFTLSNMEPLSQAHMASLLVTDVITKLIQQ